jgi:hypothetical protein
MDLNFLPELISVLVLLGAFYLVWKEHKRLRSLTPFIIGIALLLIARLSDVVIQLPSTVPAEMLGLMKASLDRLLNGVSDVADTVGVFFIVVGFVQTTRFERGEKKRIEEFEAMLPLCAWCKSYRTEKGKWLPIEKYLSESGQSLTHGICPACIEKHFKNKELV